MTEPVMQTLRIPVLTIHPEDGTRPAAGDGYRMWRADLYDGAERLGALTSGRMVGGEMVVTYVPYPPVSIHPARTTGG